MPVISVTSQRWNVLTRSTGAALYGKLEPEAGG